MKKFTKIISILLSMFILLSLTSVSVGSVNNDIANSTVTTTAVTDSTILHLNKGDVVTYCLELTVPSHLTDVSGWYIDIFYDKEILQVDRDFASGYGYACGDKAIDYATGLSDTKATLPGGSSTIVNFNNKDAISICDMGPNGLKLLGKTTKLLCLRFTAINKGSCTISYKVKEMLNFTALDSYVDVNYKLINGVKMAVNANIDRAILKGDINCDNNISKNDLSSFMGIYAKKEQNNAEVLAICDLDENGENGFADLMMLTRIIAEN